MSLPLFSTVIFAFVPAEFNSQSVVMDVVSCCGNLWVLCRGCVGVARPAAVPMANRSMTPIPIVPTGRRPDGRKIILLLFIKKTSNQYFQSILQHKHFMNIVNSRLDPI